MAGAKQTDRQREKERERERKRGGRVVSGHDMR